MNLMILLQNYTVPYIRDIVLSFSFFALAGRKKGREVMKKTKMAILKFLPCLIKKVIQLIPPFHG